MIAAALIGSQAAAVGTLLCLSQGVGKRNENGYAGAGAEQAGSAVACFALTVSLAAQIPGGRASLSPVEFRATELGAGVALLALVLTAAGTAVARQRADRYAASRPDIRAVTLAAGGAVVLAAGLGMIVSRSSSMQPGHVFPWLCLLAAVLATAASFVTRERGRAAGAGRGGYARAGDADDVADWGTPAARAAAARQAVSASRARRASHAGRASRAARDDWDPPLGERAPADRHAAVGHGEHADWDAAPSHHRDADWDAPADRLPAADWDPPAAGGPAKQNARAAQDAGAGRDADRFTPAGRRARSAQDEPDSESAASWDAPSEWFRPVKEPSRTARDAWADPDFTDASDLVSLPELVVLRDLAGLPDLDVMPDLDALIRGHTAERDAPGGRHAVGRGSDPADGGSAADRGATAGGGSTAGAGSAAGAGHAAAGFAAADRADAGPEDEARTATGAADEAGSAGARPQVHGKQPYGRITVYRLIEARAAEFDRLLGDVVEGVRAHEPDTLIYAVHKVPSAPLLRILYAVFRDKAAYAKHAESPYSQELSSAGGPLLEATNVIELGSRRDSGAMDPSAFS